MKQCAVVLNGSDIIKVSNLKRKYNKILNNPNMILVEECELEDLDFKHDYWYNTIRGKDPDYKFKNEKTGHILIREKDTLDDLKEIIKDWQDYGEPEYLW